MDEYAIGVDIGTGSTKALAINLHGKVFGDAQKYHPTITSTKGYAEQDPELIFLSFISVINNVLESMGYAPSVIGLSSCMHSLVCVDKDHTPLTPLITWADNRAAEIAEDLRKSSTGKQLHFISGTPLHAMLPMCKIIWLKKYVPAIFGKTEKFISIKEFIWYRLFKTYQVDESVASATGLFNTSKRQWDNALLKLCGICHHNLSEIVSTGSLIKYDNRDKYFDITSDLNFCIGASDGCLANLGVDSIKPGTAALTIGTSGAVRISSPNPIYDSKTNLFNYILDNKTFITGGPINNGGNTIQWLLKTFLQIEDPVADDYKKFFSLAENISPGCNGLIFLPYIHGERFPVWDEQASGIFMGIRSHHTTSHFLRAGIEGICYALKNILTALESHTTISRVNVSGGFIDSRVWLQILTDILNKTVCVVSGHDASAKGAAILAFRSVDKLQDNAASEKSETIKPDKKLAGFYEKNYCIYNQLYKVNRSNMHALNLLNE